MDSLNVLKESWLIHLSKRSRCHLLLYRWDLSLFFFFCFLAFHSWHNFGSIIGHSIHTVLSILHAFECRSNAHAEAKVSDELIARTAAWVLAAAPMPDKDWAKSSLFISSNFKHQLSFARQEHMPFVINRAHLCFLQKKFAFMINLLSSTCLCFPFLCSCFCYSVSGTAKRGEFFFWLMEEMANITKS